MEEANHVSSQHGSLNMDPYNARAEQLAMQECMSGLHVRCEWSEQQMVKTFGGSMVPGTPDGMFEEWNGDLTCVQVVRVPITSNMTHEAQEDVIYHTVLDKLVKSQQWMKATRTVPHEFVIFCWCQGWPETTGDRVQELIEQVRKEGWPFMLKLMVPTEPGELFHVKFAYQRAGREGGELSQSKVRSGKYSELDLSTYDPEDFVSSDDEAPDWYLFDDDDNVDEKGDPATDACLANTSGRDMYVAAVSKKMEDQLGVG